MPGPSTIPAGRGVFGLKPGQQQTASYPLPSSILCFGDSYLDINFGPFSTTGGLGYTDQSSYKQILGIFNLTEKQSLNRAKSGSTIIGDNSGGVLTGGGWVTVLQNYAPINPKSSFASPAKNPWMSSAGLALLLFGLNDVVSWAGGSQDQLYRAAFIEAWRTVIARCRAAAVFEEDSGAPLVFSGGGLGGAHWTQVTSTVTNSGAGFARSSTIGSSISLPLVSDQNGATVDLGFIGRPGATGGQATITIDGVIVDRINTSNMTANSVAKNGNAITGGALGMVRRYKLSPNTAHTILVTVTGVDGNFDFDYWQIEAQEPNPILVSNINKLRQYGFGTGNWDNEIDAWNPLITQVITEFDQPIQIFDLDGAINQSIAQVNADNFRINEADFTHPSELGSRYVAAAVQDAWNRMLPGPSSYIPTPMRDYGSGHSFPAVQTTAGFHLYPQGLQQGGAAFNGTAGTIYFLPLLVTRPCTFDRVNFTNITAAAGNMQLGLYADSPPNLTLGGYDIGPFRLIYDWGSFAITVAANKQYLVPAGKQKLIVPGIYWLAVLPLAGATLTADSLRGSHPYVAATTFLHIGPTNNVCWSLGAQVGLPATILISSGVLAPNSSMPLASLEVVSTP